MQFFDVQAAVANQFAVPEQNWNLVAEPSARRAVEIDVDDLDRMISRRRLRLELDHHFLAQSAAGTRVQQEAGFGGHWFGGPRITRTARSTAGHIRLRQIRLR